MQEETLDGHLARPVVIDLCFACQAFWFDRHESLSLTPASTLRLFRVIGERAAKPQVPGPDLAKCPRCRGRLRRTHDMQRATRFEYLRCPNGHGRLTTFFDFLREKNFVRPLPAERLAELRRYAPTVNCSACGAPVDLARESACGHCRAPLSMLDPDQVQAVVRDLQRAEERRTTIDPAFATRLVDDRAALERALRAPADMQALDLGGSFGVVEAGVSALVRLLSDPPDLSAP
jgi:hypothetical protein